MNKKLSSRIDEWCVALHAPGDTALASLRDHAVEIEAQLEQTRRDLATIERERDEALREARVQGMREGARIAQHYLDEVRRVVAGEAVERAIEAVRKGER